MNTGNKILVISVRLKKKKNQKKADALKVFLKIKKHCVNLIYWVRQRSLPQKLTGFFYESA